jgi:general secretion pathway protein D
VVYLRNAEAVRLAQVLRGVLAGGDPGSSAGGAGVGSGPGALGGGGTTGSAALGTNTGAALGGAQSPPGASSASPGSSPLQSASSASSGPVSINAGGAIIAADPATNSLIITAPEPLYRNLRAVIDQLDARRAQVYIESLIVEITSERAAELGIQWQMLNAPNGSTRVIGGTNLPARGSGSNILDVATNLGSIDTGLNIGVARGTVNVPGVGEMLNLGLLARALESNSAANILATPNLLTLDNEEARIIIGQNVPFVTGQFTLPAAGATATSPFQTIERKDVGTTLRVKPQVSEAGTVRMQIFQEVSSVQDRSLSAGLITNRRAIESNVLVDDGQIVVLGGLIEERVEGGVEKVPGLGDVPILGNLFRYDARRRVKTNLLVFLRPIVLRDARNAYDVTADRYEYIRALQGDSRLPQHWALPDFKPSGPPAMPQRPAPAPATGNAQPGGRNDEPAARGPASLAPDIDRAAARPAPIVRSRPTVIQSAPNEVIIPLGVQGETDADSAGPARDAQPHGASPQDGPMLDPRPQDASPQGASPVQGSGSGG